MPNTLTYAVIMAVMVLFSAYFSATETAFSSLNRTRLKTLAEKGSRKAVLACKLSEQYDKLISTILIGNNIVNIATASLGTVLFVQLCGDIGPTVSTVVVTVVVLIFGEISPKSIAKDCPERFAMFSAPFLSVLIWILTPLNEVFSAWKRLLSHLLRAEADTKMSQEELLMLVEEVQQDGSIDKDEGELLRNAIEFTEQEAGDILTHRVDLAAAPADVSKDQLAQLFSQSKFSRILIYENSIDNIVGVIHLKDFYTGSGITEQEIAKIVAPVVYVLESEKISSIMRLLQKGKTHVAVVLDEYGGTCGIVTMEDILEELVGEIWDEHDEVAEMFRRIGEHTYRVSGSVDLDDVCGFFGLKLHSEMISLSGWVMEQIGKLPVPGDSFPYEQLVITVISMDCHKVAEVEITANPAGDL